MTLPFIAYLIGCVIAGVLLTIVVSMFRSTKSLDEFKPVKWIVVLGAIAGLAPYGWHEVLTRQHGAEMEKAIKAGISDANVNGQLAYYRVMKASEKKAEVTAVATEKGQFGDPERTVVLLELSKTSGKWHTESFEFVNSYKRNKDGTTFPPFW